MTTPSTINCPGCGAALKKGGLPAGKTFRCPKCQRAITLAAAGSTAIQAGAPPSPATAIQPARRAAPAVSATPVSTTPSPKSRKPVLFAGAGVLAAVVVGVIFLIRGFGNSGTVPPPPPDPDPIPIPIDPATGRPMQVVDEPIVMWGSPAAKPLDYKKPIVLKGHRPEVTLVDLAYSPDGTKLASVNTAGEVILWNLATQQARVVTRQAAEKDASLHVTTRLVFSPDGKTLFYAGPDGVSLWDAESGFGKAKFGEFPADGDFVCPNGKTVATGNIEEGDKRYGYTIWDVASRKAFFTVQGLAFVYSVRYSPDGRFVAIQQTSGKLAGMGAASREVLELCTIRIYDTEARRELPLIRMPTKDVRFLPGNKLITWGLPLNRNKVFSVKLWNVSAEKGATLAEDLPHVEDEIAHLPILQRELSHDRKTYGYLVNDGSLALHDTTTLKTRAAVRGVYQPFVFSSDDTTVIAAGSVTKVRFTQEDFVLTIHVADASSGAARSKLEVPINPRLPDGQERSQGGDPVLAASPSHPRTFALSLPDGVILILPHEGKSVAIPKSWEITPDAADVKSGRVQLITTAPDGIVPLTAKKKAEFPARFHFADDDVSVPLALSRNASLLAAAGTDSFNTGAAFVRIRDLKTGKERWSLQPERGGGKNYQFTPDNRFLVDEHAQVFDVQSGEITKQPDDLAAACLTLAPDGKKLLAGAHHEPTLLKLLALPSLAVERATMDFVEGSLTAVKFSSDGKHLAAVLHHQGATKLLLLNPSTGEVLKALEEHEASAPENSMLDFSTDAKTLACVSEQDNTNEWHLTLWDVASGKLRHRNVVGNHNVPVLLARGRLVAAAISDATVFDVATGAVRSHLQPFDVHQHKTTEQHLCRARNRWAVGYDDGEVLVWDLARHGTIVKFKAHPAPIIGITLSVDGGTLVTAGKDSTVRVWSQVRAR